MALANYTDLVAAIQAYMMAKTNLAVPAPEFITMGEGILNYGTAQTGPLRTREMETVVTLPTVNGIAALPSDYLQFRSVVDLGGSRRNLTFISPETSDLYYPSRQGGSGNNFTIIGSSLYAFPLTTNSISLIYYAAIPPLTAAAPTNWLMTKHPQIYLRAALTMAAEYIKNDGELTKQASLLASLIGGMNQQNMVAEYSRAKLMPSRAIA